jgi:Mg-chelatase subunit ChlD
MISLDQPWNILWALPLLLFWFKFGRPRAAYFLLISFALIVLVLMKPTWVSNSSAPMLVIVLDRSLSVKEEQLDLSKGFVRKALLLAPSNKMALVTFGKNVAVEKWFDENFDGEIYLRYIDPESSSLNDALLLACSLIPNNKAGKVLLITDGEYRGVNPLIAATEAQRRNIKIDLMRLNLELDEDVGVSDISLPVRVASNETFQLSVDLFSTKETEVTYELRRLGVVIAKGKVSVPINGKTLSFVDTVSKPGSHLYEFQIKSDTDSVTQNNTAKGILQVDGIERILVINSTGSKDNFSRALEGAGKEVVVFESKKVEISIGMLEAYQLIVLENVPADHFSEMELKAIQISVEYYGKSLLMTGGRASFGIGGYLNSVIEPLLPVDMVAKNEKRQIQIGICLMLDRSGSMAAAVGMNKTKMDLADMGSEATLRLLSPRDEISVIAIDTEPHYIVPMATIGDNTESFARKILSIESTGGGINTYTALVAGVKEIEKSKSGTKHMILFADAADADEYGDSVKLCAEVFSSGVTVSVVALGNESDKDSDFLKDVAKAGQGRIFFTEDAESLPRLFTQDVVQVKRNSFDENETSLIAGSGLTSLGAFPFQELPKVSGVNMNYIKSDTQIMYMSQNEYNTPGITSWMAGAGKVMAISFEVDGQYTGKFASWDKYDKFFASLGRYLIPREKNSLAVLKAERNGHQVTVQLQTDPSEPIQEDIKIEVFSGNNLSAHTSVPLRLIEEGVYQGQYNLEDSSPHFHMCRYKKEIVKGNAVILPYSPEYDKSGSNASRNIVLDRIMQQTQGKKHLLVSSDILDEAIPVIQKIDILLPIVFFSLLFLMLDILQKRIEFRFPSWRKKKNEEIVEEEQQIKVEEKPIEAEDAFSIVKKKSRK